MRISINNRLGSNKIGIGSIGGSNRLRDLLDVDLLNANSNFLTYNPERDIFLFRNPIANLTTEFTQNLLLSNNTNELLSNLNVTNTGSQIIFSDSIENVRKTIAIYDTINDFITDTNVNINTFNIGDIVRAGNFYYTIETSNANSHLTTVNSIKANVYSPDGIYFLESFNPVADGVTDDSQIIHKTYCDIDGR